MLHGVLDPSAWFANDMSITSAGWPSAADEVDEAAVGDEVDAAAVGHRELLDELARHPRLGRERRSAGISISTLKWPVFERIAPSFISS